MSYPDPNEKIKFDQGDAICTGFLTCLAISIIVAIAQHAPSVFGVIAAGCVVIAFFWALGWIIRFSWLAWKRLRNIKGIEFE